ncbi:3-isopropylmalate dehydratase large subunit [bacterium]|nr:3-isopropylmalate dehydratase large subunit [bacterium]
MPQTMIEKIISTHAGRTVKAGEIADIVIDARVARDFGGANVVKNLEDNGLSIADSEKTFFTFDCNPGGSDQKYATNQQKCRIYAREHNIQVYDIDTGIGTHAAIDKGLILPGGTFVSTDSHANIMGAIGAFGQGMGDQDIAAAWANGRIWFKVPKSMKVMLRGSMPEGTYAKDVVLRLLQEFGAAGLLGYSAEFYGEAVDAMGLSDRITVASMATEMGGIIALFPPSEDILEEFTAITGKKVAGVYADEDAVYDKTIEISLDDLEPMISRPGHPEDATTVKSEAGRKIDSAFIGSCTNGRFEDMQVAARILKGKKVAPGVVLKIVPATREIWQRCLDEGLIEIFMEAGALVGNAGCAGCAAGQIGQNGPGEVTVSTGNRNFAGKQGKGEVYLASPATVAASAVSGVISSELSMPAKPAVFAAGGGKTETVKKERTSAADKPRVIDGRVWVIDKDNIDTDMIFHNRYLTITNIAEMGQYTFDNLEGWEDFAKKARPGDIVITGGNFGAGSSRQQAVDCFASLGVQAVVARSFGAIYERNAINSGFPIVVSDILESGIESGEDISIDLTAGTITRKKTGETIAAEPFSDIQLEIYRKGGLLNL